MKNIIKEWVNKFLTENMFLQVKTIQRIAILGFILFTVVLIYLWQFKIEVIIADKSEQKNVFELFIEKK